MDGEVKKGRKDGSCRLIKTMAGAVFLCCLFCAVTFFAKENVYAAGAAGSAGNGFVQTDLARIAQIPDAPAFVPSSGDKNTYDIVLFWGQSNMLGLTIADALPAGFNVSDPKGTSLLSGVDPDIVSETVNARTAAVKMPENAGLYYDILTDSLIPIRSSQFWMGKVDAQHRGIGYNPVTQQFEAYGSTSAFEPSMGASVQTNLIPEFCRRYYEKTGHRVIVLFAAVGGVGIRGFLPMTDPQYVSSASDAKLSYSFINESILMLLAKVNAYTQSHGMKIGGRYWVSFQGETDIGFAGYKDVYERIVSEWRAAGFTKGALIETSYTNGRAGVCAGVEQMHAMQEQIIAENPDIVLGSDFDYRRYIPDPASYVGAEAAKWGNLPYAQAYVRAAMNVDVLPENCTHLNTPSLCQIGRESADHLAAAVTGR